MNSLGDIWTFHLSQDLNLLLNIINLVVCTFEVDNLDSDRTTCCDFIPGSLVAVPLSRTWGRIYPWYTSPKLPCPDYQLGPILRETGRHTNLVLLDVYLFWVHLGRLLTARSGAIVVSWSRLNISSVVVDTLVSWERTILFD